MIALGVVADDFTGGTDVAAALRRAGLSVTLQFGAPDPGAAAPRTDAVVIALKTRTVAPDRAVEESLTALRWLQSGQTDRYYFKYCSTFDSTDEGNIGPVADALLTALRESTTLICPASPEHGRTSYLGHLFVGEVLLSESSLRHHPLTPMTDPLITRVLERQASGPVGLLPLPVVQAGPAMVAAHLDRLRDTGTRHVVVDAVTDADLRAVALGAHGLRLLTGGAGLAGAVAAVVATQRRVVPAEPDAQTRDDGPTSPAGPGLVLAGSCSSATLAQVAAAAQVLPSYRLDPARTPGADQLLAEALRWVDANWHRAPLLVYSSAGPEERAAARAAMGPHTPEVLERTLGQVAVHGAELGARRIVVAGGETSGAVVRALDVDQVVVGGEADRGVPWCATTDGRGLALLLKSGNFGAPDLLVRAVRAATDGSSDQGVRA